MNPIEEPSETGIVSELIDLEDIPLATVRELDNVAVTRSLEYVEKQADRPSKTETSCSSLSTF